MKPHSDQPAQNSTNLAALLQNVLPNANTFRSRSAVRRGDTSTAPAGSARKAGILAQALCTLLSRSRSAGAEAPVRDGRWRVGSFANAAGRREYKLFVPSGYQGQAVPLIVMLHGCTQSADDFAAGTQMNVVADEYTCLVAYPEQPNSANISKCWNWFNASHQRRDAGEPSLIAGITHQIMREYAVDPRRVYVAGLSAGAAQAAIMGVTYPDIYAAIGVHSGLPYGAARNLPAGLAAMRNGAATASVPASDRIGRVVPAIVFHGDSDTTVHPSNGDRMIPAASPDLQVKIRSDRVAGGRAYTRTDHLDADGTPRFEQWVVHGAGHAWSGGSSAGSYTDPLGPNAAREMLRFFLQHVRV